MELLIHRNM